MISDIKLQPDFDIPPTGDLESIEGFDCVLQTVDIELNILLGTYFADLERGFPTVEVPGQVDASRAIGGNKFDRLKAIRELTRSLNKVPGIDSVKILSVAFDAGTRELTGEYEAVTSEGQTITQTFTRTI